MILKELRGATMRNKINRAVRGFWRTVERAGCAAAASRLANMGYHEEAKRLILNCHK
jgi:hypothetical protein